MPHELPVSCCSPRGQASPTRGADVRHAPFRRAGRCDMVKGLATVIYHVTDLDQAKTWYSTAFQQTPYFDQPFYVGFNIAGYELGLDPNPSVAQAERAGSV